MCYHVEGDPEQMGLHYALEKNHIMLQKSLRGTLSMEAITQHPSLIMAEIQQIESATVLISLLKM